MDSITGQAGAAIRKGSPVRYGIGNKLFAAENIVYYTEKARIFRRRMGFGVAMRDIALGESVTIGTDDNRDDVYLSEDNMAMLARSLA